MGRLKEYIKKTISSKYVDELIQKLETEDNILEYYSLEDNF